MSKEKIQDFIEGRLPSAEKSAFEQQLESAAELRADYLQELARHIALQASARADAKNELKKMLGQQAPNHGTVRQLRPMWIASAIAAGVLLLFSLSYLFYFQKSPDPGQLAMAYFEPYPLSNARGEFSDQQELLDDALIPYQNQDFEKALPYLRQLHQQDAANIQLSLNLASALLALEQAGEAVALLEDMQTVPQAADAVSWYLCLAYLQSGRPEEAKALLQQISTQPHYRRQQAKNLLEEL